VFGLRGWAERDGRKLRPYRTISGDPLLAEVLHNVPVQARVLLDPKETRSDRRRALRNQLAEQLPELSRFLVSTDDVDDLDGYRTAGFTTLRTVGSKSQLDRVLAGGADLHDGLSIEHTLVRPATAGRLRELSPLLVAWTVNTVTRAAELTNLGVGGITSDNPEVLRWVASRPTAAEGS
jgi:glycerophosphoryl diester phosphodiesterase